MSAIINLDEMKNSFQHSHNGVEDLLTEEELKEYNSMGWPDNVSILHDALKKKIEEDPDYELWVPVRYVRFSTFNINNNLIYTFYKYKFISNKGNYENLTDPVKNRKKISKRKARYIYNSLKLDEHVVVNSAGRQRLVALAFVPRNGRFREVPFTELMVNHLDGITINNDFTNLEWCDSEHNNNHAFNTGLNTISIGVDHPLTKPLLGTINIPGKYFGIKFIVCGKTEFQRLFSIASVVHPYRVANGFTDSAYGCKWSYATNEQITNYSKTCLDENAIKLLRSFKGTLKDPILATRISDGHLLILIGSDQIKKYGFNPTNVYRCCNGLRTSHAKYKFKRINEEELKNLVAIIDSQTTKF